MKKNDLHGVPFSPQDFFSRRLNPLQYCVVPSSSANLLEMAALVKNKMEFARGRFHLFSMAEKEHLCQNWHSMGRCLVLCKSYQSRLIDFLNNVNGFEMNIPR